MNGTIPLRVVLFTGSYPPQPCGVGDYTRHLLEHLSARDGVTLEAWVGTGWPGDTDPRIRRVLDPSWWTTLRNIGSALREFQPHVIHFQFPTQGYGRRFLPWILPLLLRAWGVRIVATWHEYFSGWLPRALPSALAASAVIVVRPGYEERLRPTTRVALGRARVHLVPNASAIPRVVHDERSREELRQQAGCGRRRLIAYFGFAYPAKGVHLLFDLLDPEREMLVLIGRLEPDDPYQRSLLDRCAEPRWRDATYRAGWQPEAAVGAWLAAADAVLLPFASGGGAWNSSLHAAVTQGTFVLTTATERRGYEPTSNIYFALPGDLREMRLALEQHCGVRLSAAPAGLATWPAIAEQHHGIYRDVMGSGS
jgi:glycosyltransferase involved in cell wall biosynthesis